MGVSVAIGAAVGAVIGGAAAAIQSGGNFDAIWKGALVGAAGGAVAGWAAPALAPALGAVGGAMAGGALGGAVAGLGNVALNGGNGSDYLTQGLMGAGLGAVTGGAMEASGANAALGNAIEGMTGTPAAPTATPGVEAGTAGITTGEAGVTPTAESLTPSAAPAGTGTEATTGNVFQSAPEPTLANTLFASNQTMTDVPLGMQSQPQLLSGGSDLNAPNTTSFGMDTSFSGTPKFAGSDVSFGNFGNATAPEGGGLFNAGFGDNLSPIASPSDYSAMSDPYGNKYSDLYGDNWNKAMEAANAGKSYDPENLIGNYNTKPEFDWMGTAKDLGKGLLMSGGGRSLLGGIMKGAAIPNARSAAQQNNQQLMDLYNLQKQGYQQQLAQQASDAARNQQIYEQNKQAFQNNLETQAANRGLLNEQQANAANYNKQLSSTYTNPNEYLNTPEAQAARAMAMQKLLAQNAQAGRRSAGLGLQNQLMMNQMAGINAYRQGLNNAIRYPGYLGGMSGMSYAPQTTASAAGMLNTLGAAQQWNPDFQTGAGLSSIFY